MKVDFDGNVLTDTDVGTIKGGALIIHAGLLKHRRDLNATPPALLTENWVGANFTDEAERSDEQKALHLPHLFNNLYLWRIPMHCG